MTLSQIAQTVESLQPQLRELGVARLLLVGSAARDRLRDDSDLDFVVEFKGPATFLGYMEVAERLEEALGRTVDLSTMASLRPEISAEILAEARRVA